MSEQKSNKTEDGTIDLVAEACRQVAKAVTGNGVDPTDVRVIEKHQEMFTCSANIDIKFNDSLSEQNVVGNKVAGETCESKEEMHKKIDAVKQNTMDDPHVLFLLVKKLKEITGNGWGEPQKIVLKELCKDYFYSETCGKCQGKAKLSCPKCHGKGQVNCFNCRGFGLMDCLYCMGNGQVPDGNGGQKECAKCYGKRKNKCTECVGKKYMICDTCRGAKYISCKNCGKTGSVSVQTHVEFEISSDANIDVKTLPPSVAALYEGVGKLALAKDLHAEITLIVPNEIDKASEITALEENSEEENEEPNKKAMDQHDLRYQLKLPMGHGELSVGEKRYKLSVVGYQSWISEIDNFLDPLVASGIKALQKISKGPMAQQALIDKALKYRLVKEVFSRIGKMSKGQILKFVKHEYPRGLSDKYAKAVVQFAYKAIGKITEKPKMMGMGLGVSISSVVLAAWFFVPLRKMVEVSQQSTADILLTATMAGISYYIVRIFASKALSKFMESSSKKSNMKKQALPPAGIQGIYTVVAIVCVFLAMSFLAK